MIKKVNLQWFVLFSLIGALAVITVIHIFLVLYRFDSPNPNIQILSFFLKFETF